MAFDAFKKIWQDNQDDEYENLDDNENVLYDDSASSGKPRFVLRKPVDRSELAEIAQDLMQGRIVVLNLENINKLDIRRYLDFLQGTIFALRGETKKVDENAYMFIPGKADVNGIISEDDEKLV